jgi:ABC-type amino acid transport substrate-binding protein
MTERSRPAACILAAALVLLASIGVRAADTAHGARLERIAAAGELRVCIWPEYYGVSFHNAKSNTITGVDADLAQEFARELKVRLRFVNSSFARLIDDVVGDHCDIAMMAVAITPQRQERLAFSKPHLRTDVYMVTTRNNPRVRKWEDLDRSGVRIGVAAGTVHEALMRERLKHSELVVVNAPQTREGELEAGRIDAFMSDFPFTRKMVDYHDWVRVIAPTKAYFPVFSAFALKPGEAEWLQRVDQFVAAVKADGRLGKAAERYGLEPIVVRE